TSHEVSESLTDPLGNAWWDSSGDANGGNENGDNCAYDYGAPVGGSGLSAYNQVVNGHHYFTQQEWVNETGTCVQTYTNPLTASFTAPSTAEATQSLSFNAAASSDTGGTVTSYRMVFADGVTASQASPSFSHA